MKVSRAAMYRYLNRVRVRSPRGGLSGYFHGCTAYLDNGHVTVLLRHRRNPRLRRAFPVLALDPPTIEVDDPHNYDGFVPLTPMAA
jgi:hypothetical protein